MPETCTTEQQPTQVEQELDGLEGEITSLTNFISAIEERLDRVLTEKST